MNLKHFLLLFAMLMSIAAPVSADIWTDEHGITWNYTNVEGGVQLDGATGYGESTFSIPSLIDGKKIISINSYAFSGCSNLISVGDLSSCTSIGEWAFNSCSKLTSIGDLSSCTSIGYNAFYGCSSLTSVDLSSCTSIEYNTFSGCSSLTSVDLSSCTSIGDNAFYECSCLTSVGDLSSCTSIGSSAFQDCSSLTSVDLSSCTSIGNQAFHGCSKLTTVGDLSSCTSIGNSEFYGCASITSVDLSSCTSIGYNAFYGCSNLTSVGDLTSCTSIGANAFAECKNLTSVDLSSCTSIENSAFSGCTNLCSVGDLGSCTSIGSYAFYNCSSITSIGDLSSCTSIGNHAFYGCTSLTSIDLSSCTSIRSDAFYGCTSLISIDLSSCTSIGSLAFENCTSLTSIGDLSSCTSIEYRAFWDCKNLTSVDLSSCTSIEEWAFYGCSNLTSIGDLGSCTSIGNSAFYNCSSITSIGNLSSCTSIGENAFVGCKNLTSMDLSSCTSIGNSAFSGCSNLTSIGDLGSCTSIGSDAFINCSNLTSVDLSSCTSIGNYAFSNCSNLTSVDLSSCTSIGNSAFSNCSNLTSVDLSSCTSIGNSAFSGCSNLTSVGDLSSCTSIGANAFAECKKLTSVDLSSCTLIEDCAFSGCTNLCSVGDLGSCTSIGSYAFYNCSSITSIGDLSSCTSIGEASFAECGKLTSVGDLRSCTSIGRSAFLGCYALVENKLYLQKIQNIGNDALFPFYQITLPMVIPTLTSSSTFDKNALIIVPAEAYENYCNADIWKEIKNRIAPDNATFALDLEVKAQDVGSGLLKAAGGDDKLQYVQDLKLNGTINGYDIMVIRNRMPVLANLDLTDVDIVANPYEYYTGCNTEDHRLGNSAFRGLGLINVTLPKNITYVGIEAFTNCPRLVSVKMYDNVNTIGNYAFYADSNLKNVILGEGLLSIGYYAFYNCYALSKITIPNSCYEIGNDAFRECSKLEEITLPANLQEINYSTFQGCNNLKNIAIPSKVKYIAENAFYGSSVQSVHIPPMVESIGSGAFGDCNALKDVYIYVANPRDIPVSQYAFSCWSTATLHIPSFSYDAYYWDTQWGQFYNKVEFTDTYDSFYTKNTLTLDENTGTIDGTPDAFLYDKGGLVVEGSAEQNLNEVELNSDGKDGASIIPENASNIKANKVKIKIKVTANQWHFFCFPFNIPLDGIHYGGECVWRRYDGAARSRREGGWQNLAADATQLDAGRGYIFQGNTNGNITITIDNPEFTTYDVQTGLQVHTSDNPQDANWNFLGNPYTSYYNMDATSLSEPITIWTGNGYEAYRPGDDAYAFAPYEAFFVQTPNGKSSVDFTADARQTYSDAQETVSNAKMMKAKAFAAKGEHNISTAAMQQQRYLVNLELRKGDESGYIDKTRVVFNENSRLAYESSCDAAKFFSQSRGAEIFTTDGEGNEYAINERPVEEGKVMMSIAVNSPGEYTIAASRLDVPVYLLDNATGITHDLSNSQYTFTAEETGIDNSRFMISLDSNVSTAIRDAATESKLKAGKEYDIMGRDIKEETKGIHVKKGMKYAK